MNKILFLLVIFKFACVLAKNPQECEVCESVINRLRENLPNDAKPTQIEEEFKKFCKKAEGKDEKFCYYIGGVETSATYILPEMSKPMSWNMPADKICREKLFKKDPQVCDLKYDKKIDLDTVDIKKLKVKDLRKILNDWGEYCNGCTEKTDFIRKIEEVKHLHTKTQKKAKSNEDF